MPKPPLHPPGFFTDEGGPGLAFFPAPALGGPTMPGPKDPIVSVQLHIAGRLHPLPLAIGDVEQLAEFLLACLEHVRPEPAKSGPIDPGIIYP